MKFDFKLSNKKKKKNIDNFSYATIHPARDWFIILIVFACICFAGAVWSAYLFYISRQAPPQSFESTGSTQNEEGTAIQKVLNFYEEKAERHNEARRIAPSVADPSI
jgi:hypothetical protein